MDSLNNTISADELRRLIDYDPATGLFYWRARYPEPNTGWNTRYSGKMAGSLSRPKQTAGAYWKVRIHSRDYKAHRLAWLYMTGEWPANDVDHIDGSRKNNQFANLRLATRQENLRNSRLSRRNQVGLKGVCKCTTTGRYRAEIYVNGKNLHLGRFDTPELAHAAYVDAARIHFGAFAHNGE